MILDIIIPGIIWEFAPLIVMITFAGLVFSMTQYVLDGSTIYYSILYGFIQSIILVLSCMILVSLIMPTPIHIQIINFSVGAP
jgi:hypothetical protein